MNRPSTPFSSPPTAPCHLITRQALTTRVSSLRSLLLSFPLPLTHDTAGLSTPPAEKHGNKPSFPPYRPSTTSHPFHMRQTSSSVPLPMHATKPSSPSPQKRMGEGSPGGT